MESSASSSKALSSEKSPSRNVIHNSEEIKKRLYHIYSLTADKLLLKFLKENEKSGLILDDVNNRLMGLFRDYALVESYSLLYELNSKQFLLIIYNKIKYYCHLLDPRDILQDVFLSIYRYPHRFQEGKKHAFRNWSYSIIRNTIFKHLKMRDNNEGASEGLLEILEDRKAEAPLNQLVKRESLRRFKKLYIFYLILYMNVVNNYLSGREKLALHLVEVEDKRYREASEILGIKLENFKMVVCRARKKILKRMNQLLGEEEP